MRFIFNLIPIGIMLSIVALAFGWEWVVAAVVVFFGTAVISVWRESRTPD